MASLKQIAHRVFCNRTDTDTPRNSMIWDALPPDLARGLRNLENYQSPVFLLGEQSINSRGKPKVYAHVQDTHTGQRFFFAPVAGFNDIFHVFTTIPGQSVAVAHHKSKMRIQKWALEEMLVEWAAQRMPIECRDKFMDSLNKVAKWKSDLADLKCAF